MFKADYCLINFANFPNAGGGAVIIQSLPPTPILVNELIICSEWVKRQVMLTKKQKMLAPIGQNLCNQLTLCWAFPQDLFCSHAYVDRSSMSKRNSHRHYSQIINLKRYEKRGINWEFCRKEGCQIFWLSQKVTNFVQRPCMFVLFLNRGVNLGIFRSSDEFFITIGGLIDLLH